MTGCAIPAAARAGRSSVSRPESVLTGDGDGSPCERSGACARRRTHGSWLQRRMVRCVLQHALARVSERDAGRGRRPIPARSASGAETRIISTEELSRPCWPPTAAESSSRRTELPPRPDVSRPNLRPRPARRRPRRRCLGAADPPTIGDLSGSFGFRRRSGSFGVHRARPALDVATTGRLIRWAEPRVRSVLAALGFVWRASRSACSGCGDHRPADTLGRTSGSFGFRRRSGSFGVHRAWAALNTRTRGRRLIRCADVGSVRFSAALRLVRMGLVRMGLVRMGLVRMGLVRIGLVRSASCSGSFGLGSCGVHRARVRLDPSLRMPPTAVS